MKMIFLMARVTELMVRLAGWIRPPPTPFSAFPPVPGVRILDTLSEMPEDLESWENFSTVETEAANTDAEDLNRPYTGMYYSPVTPASPGSSMVGSQITEAQDEYLTDEVRKKLGPPPLCQHGQYSKVFLTRKQGPNFGRLFWRCAHSRQEQCRYFAWAEHQPTWSPVEMPALPKKGGTGSMTSQKTRTGSTRGSSSKGSVVPSPSTPQPNTPPTTPGGTCRHLRTTRTGTNGYVDVERCVDCGYLVKKEKKKSPSPNVITREKLEEFQEFQEYQNWRKSQGRSAGSKAP